MDVGSLPGPHPSSWGPSGTPPGWEIPGSPSSSSLSPALGPLGPFDPVINFYSNQNGSAGNFTWDVTLPVDRNATANQSDLYSAVEFAMVATARGSWMGECLLELQLYPDATWGAPSSDNGNWIGAVVGWQVQTTTGAEDTCFYYPLYVNGNPGSSFFDMTQGDRLNVTFNGWPGDPTGEVVTVKDLTSGQQSYVTAYNDTGGNYPVDPAYSANNIPDALQWGTGGDYPAFFGLLTGRGGNPTVPANNSLGGCSPGIPPSTPANPAVPCPSYDPGSWINDTLHPWQIGLPTFFNVTTRSSPPAQVAFSQAYGGINVVSDLAATACGGRLGSAYCSFPWFSFSCGVDAFEFGATDYPGVSADFGKYTQYARSYVLNAAQYPYYPATSFAVPTCNSPGFELSVGPATPDGLVTFLSQNFTSESNVMDLGAGEYQVEATPHPGEYFAGWTTTGGISVAYPDSPWTPFELTGTATLLATFSSTPTEVAVTFDDSPSGEAAVTPGWLATSPGDTATVPSGSVLELTPGVYSVLAYPPIGFNFSEWAASAAGIVLGSPSTPLAYFVVTGISPNALLTANSALSPSFDRVGLIAYNPANDTFGGGKVSLGGFLTTTKKVASGWIGVGTYNLSASPATGYTFGGWYYTQSALMLNFSAETNITLENGTLSGTIPAGLIVAIFEPNPVAVTFGSVPAGGGVIVGGLGFVPTGSSVALIPGENYSVSAAPGNDQRFLAWMTLNTGTVWNRDPSSWAELLVVNSSGTDDVTYGVGAAATLTFLVSPMSGGLIGFNGDNQYANGSQNSSIAVGESYTISETPAAGFEFTGWSTYDSVTVGSTSDGNTSVTPAGSGELIAQFAPIAYYVTILAVPAQAGSVSVDGTSVSDGATLLLTPGSYPISVTAPGATFDAWSATSNLLASPSDDSSSTLTVSGPGTLTAVITPFQVSVPTVSHAQTDVGVAVTLTATTPAAGTYTASWNDLPTGCTSEPMLVLECTPTAPGTFAPSVTLTDAWGEAATSAAASVQVNPLPTLVSVALSHPTVDVGVATYLNVVEAGGTAPLDFGYENLPMGCNGYNATALVCAVAAAGSWTIQVTVTDALGESDSESVTLLVNPLPTAELTLSASSVRAGSYVTITPSVAGGTGPFSYRYSGLPSGCQTSIGAIAFVCQPTKPGTYEVNLTVTDEFGKQANATVVLTVTAAPGPLANEFTTYLAIGLVLLVVIALVAFIALRRKPRKPTIVAIPEAAAARRPSARPPPPTSVPEWSEEPPPPQEWREGQ